jgi:hypothetical protein
MPGVLISIWPGSLFPGRVSQSKKIVMVRSRWSTVFMLTLAVGCQQPKVNVTTKLIESKGLDRTVLQIRKKAGMEFVNSLEQLGF